MISGQANTHRSFDLFVSLRVSVPHASLCSKAVVVFMAAAGVAWRFGVHHICASRLFALCRFDAG